ncbi:MAG TPA: hypothetical protein VF551_02840 [Chthoniobacterales bacterium]
MLRNVLFLSFLLALASCSKPASDQAANSSPAKPARASLPPVDACALLTSEDIQAVQGEPIQEVKPSAPSDGTYVVAQCYFALATASNSVVLTVTQDGAAEAKEFWRETFHDEGGKGEKGEEEEEKGKPAKVDGIGDEAFWSGNAIGGALYVLKGERFIRISVGGAGDANAKLEKSNALASAVHNRL